MTQTHSFTPMKIFNTLEEWLGGGLFLVMFAVMVLQILVRLIPGLTILPWTEELSRLIFVYVAMLGISIGIRKQQHIYVDFFTDKLPPKFKKFAFSVSQVLIFVCIVLFFKLGLITYFREASKANDLIVTLGIATKWLYLALIPGSVLMLVRFLQLQQENYRQGLSYLPALPFLVLAVVLFLVGVIEPNWFNSFKLGGYHHFNGTNAAYIALGVWLVIMFLGVPVGWSLMIASLLYYSMTRWGIVNSAAAKLIGSVNSFALLSVPLFILTGLLMNSAGITTRIFNFAKAVLGHYTGGMGHVNIFASLVFSGMSGSALADAGGLGQMEIKAMRDAGYSDDICGGLTAASCIIGPLVPPSIALIIYGVLANQSIASLFVAGFVPGLILTIALMVMNYLICKKRGYVKQEKAPRGTRRRTFVQAFWALLTPLIIIIGIFRGWFSPTEAAAAAASYATILGLFVYKELTLKALFKNCVEAVAISGVVVLMVMTVTFFGDMIVREQLALKIASGFMSVADSPLMVLLMINLLLLFLGMFIDALALQFLVLPMLIPIATAFHIDLVFFGVMTTLNMMIGILTPPMGMALFVVARVGNMPVSTVTRGAIPFIIPIFITLVVLTIFPQIVTFLPNLLMH